MKVIFMGTPDFAVPTLNKLLNHDGVEVCLVVTQPDKPNKRGNRIEFCDVKKVAVENNIIVFQPERIKLSENVEFIKSFAPDLIVVVAYGQILSKAILDIPKFGCMNVHGSLLPKYRGAAPIHYAVMNGETETGVTIMYMDEGMDTGDIILKKKMEITPKDNTMSMYEKMANLGACAMDEVIDLIFKDEVTREKQKENEATYAHIIKKEIGKIDWTQSSDNIVNKVRGLNPWPSAFALLNGETYKILDAEKVNLIKAGKKWRNIQ